LANTAKILGGVSGITATSAMITNSGTIAGQTYGIRSDWGGIISNSGLISSAVDGVLLLNEQYQAKYATSLLNYGTIQGGYFALAVNFAYATNAASGRISGATFGAGAGGSAYIYNAGTISGSAGGLLIESGGRAANSGSVSSAKIGVELFSDGSATNTSSGFVYSQSTAALNQAAYLLNDGTISGNTYGVELLSGGIAVNSGSIISRQEGVYLATLGATSSPDFLGNTGTIYGLDIGVNLKNGTAENYGLIHGPQIAVSMVLNTSFRNYGYLYGARYGAQLQGGTLVNAGSVGGKTDGVRLTHGYLTNSGTMTGGKYAVYGTSFSLTIDPSAVFHGNVVDKSKTSKLILGGSPPGTLSGLGTAFNAFNTIQFDAGAHWLISGTATALAAKQVISGFEQGDTIVLAGFSASSDSFVTNTGLKLISGSSIETLDITGSFTTANFLVSSSGTVTTIALNATAPCFVAGTRILTPRGEIPVEALVIGEAVITLGGEDRPIIWIGHRTIDLARHPHPARVQPIRIAADSLGDNVPHRELQLSPDHALLIDGALVPAQLLLNGLTIRQDIGGSKAGQVTYYHVELDRHSVIFAENTAVESYLETGNRNAFENAGGEIVLHPDFSEMIRSERSCAALLLEGEALEAIRSRNLKRYRPSRKRFNL
jgi:hypothetical protein